MITSFGLFKSVRENTPDPCIEVYFSNTGSSDAFFEVVTCDGNNITMDLAPFESSINYCVTNDSWTLDPGIVVNTVQLDCLNDGDITTPAPAPTPARK